MKKVFFKLTRHGISIFVFNNSQLTNVLYKKLLMAGFEPGSPGLGRDCSAKCATTPAHMKRHQIDTIDEPMKLFHCKEVKEGKQTFFQADGLFQQHQSEPRYFKSIRTPVDNITALFSPNRKINIEKVTICRKGTKAKLQMIKFQLESFF